VSKKQIPPTPKNKKKKIKKGKKTRSSESDPVAAMNLKSLYYIISFLHTKLFRNVKAGKIDLIRGGIGET
jgi:hypothetical protein